MFLIARFAPDFVLRQYRSSGLTYPNPLPPGHQIPHGSCKDLQPARE
jgi:hypothetical protein